MKKDNVFLLDRARKEEEEEKKTSSLSFFSCSLVFLLAVAEGFGKPLCAEPSFSSPFLWDKQEDLCVSRTRARFPESLKRLETQRAEMPSKKKKRKTA